MVGARGLMRANPIDNSSHITPGDDGVDQPVTATICGSASPNPRRRKLLMDKL
jgi:hypothetical protein